MKLTVVLLMLLFVVSPFSFVSALSPPQHIEISEFTVALDISYSASLNVSFYQLQDTYSERAVYSSYIQVYEHSYKNVTLIDPYLPINVTVKGLFGANITGFHINEGPNRFTYSAHYNEGYGYINFSSISNYETAPFSVTVGLDGQYVGRERMLNVSFVPAALPGEVLDLTDSFGAVSSSMSIPGSITFPYGDVVTYHAKDPRTWNQIPPVSRFNYDVSGNTEGPDSVNMSENVSLSVIPVVSTNPAFIMFVFPSEFESINVKSDLLYSSGIWVNETKNITSNDSENYAEGYTSSGYAVNNSPPVESLISIYLPPPGGGSNVTYSIYDLLNNSEWHYHPGYFNFTSNGSYGYLILTNVTLLGAPTPSLYGMLKMLIEFTGALIGILSIVILVLLAFGMMTNGEAGVKETIEKFRALVYMDLIFFIVFTTGAVFWLAGG